MKLMSKELVKLKTYDSQEGKSMEDFIKYANRLFFGLTIKVTVAFERLVEYKAMVCNYALNMLMQIIEVKRLVLALRESTCEHLITEFLLWDSDGRITDLYGGRYLLKTWESLIVKILANVEQTTTYLLLINLLRPRNMFIASRNQKFSDMVVKRLTVYQHHPTHINDINIDRILLSIHFFLQEHGMEEIMKREGAEDESLTIVKMLLCGLSKSCGTTITSHLSMIPTRMEPQPIILGYINNFLQAHMQNPEQRPCICQRNCNIGDRSNTASSSKSYRYIDDGDKLKFRAGKRSSFTCCGCKESGIGQRYECKAEECIGCKGSEIGDRYKSKDCWHSFHPDCVCYVDGATQRFLQGSTFKFYLSRVNEIERIRICHACGREINGFSYHCEETLKNLHPSCLNLEETCRIGAIRYQLCEKLTSECFLCHGEKGCYKNYYWGYSSEVDNWQVHVSCMIDWQVKDADDGDEEMDKTIEKKVKTKAHCVIQ